MKQLFIQSARVIYSKLYELEALQFEVCQGAIFARFEALSFLFSLEDAFESVYLNTSIFII